MAELLQPVQKIGAPDRLQALLNRCAVVLALALTGASANAAVTFDVSEILTMIGLAVVAAATIGVAWLGFSAGISIWKQLRRAT
ncbi:major capsid protein [Acinetobacter sp. ANC 5659]|uniref:major capsid protein n=1 Tax=Acinetobacter higginsii TaxID=70347 RepID=UPI001F4ADC06|nr:major capsid protein [Acinetobacter higginsii]MCH7320228.1 major capsid protein [Acinetobacter higginsii]